VSGVETWSTKGNKVLNKLNGIRVSYTNDESTFAGFEVGEHTQLSWDPSQATIKHADASSYCEALHPILSDPSGIFIRLTDGRALDGKKPRNKASLETT
jgi:hypothetical protein